MHDCEKGGILSPELMMKPEVTLLSGNETA